MIALIVSIFVGWLLIRWLFSRGSIQIEPPPQIVLHLHLIVPLERANVEKILGKDFAC